MSQVFIGNTTQLFYNKDAENNIPNAPTFIEVQQLAEFPQVKIISTTNQYETYNDEYVSILAANKNIQAINIVVHYIPDDVSHKFLDDAFSKQTHFQIKVSLYESQTSNDQHYAIVNGYISSAQLSGDRNSVVDKTYVFTAEDVVARGTAQDMPALNLGDYGVGANGTDIPQYESATPSGNSFIKVPASQTQNPTGVDMLGIANVDNTNTTKLVMTESGTFSIYGKNQSSGWTQILTKPQSDAIYVPMTRTVNGKSLSANITLNSADTGSLALTGGTLTGALSGTTATFSGAVQAGSATIRGALSGTTATFSGKVQADSASITGNLTVNNLTIQNATIQNKATTKDIEVTGTTTVTTLAGTSGIFSGAVKASSLELITALPITSGGTGANNSTTARTNLVAAKSGANSDISSLSGISTGLLIRGMTAEEGTEGNGITIESADPVGSSFGIANIGGGAAVFHNYVKPANGSGQPGDSLIGGYGSRPWTGANYTEHSNTAIHFVMDGQASPSNHGGWTRILTCPKGQTQGGRRQTLATSNNGDLWIGYDVPMGINGMAHSYFNDNSQNWDGRGMKQMVNSYSELNVMAPANGVQNPSIVFRGTPFGGTALNRSATPGGSSVWIGIDGHDGSTFCPMSAGIRFVPSSNQNWSSSNTGAGIIFSTTALNSRTRADRWSITGDGLLMPLADGNQAIGSPSLRLSAVYSINGVITTSDARLKSEIREFNDAEINAAKALSKEIGFFSWVEKQKEEGDLVREHVGMTVQRAIEIMEKNGLDPMHYGFICHNTWEESSEVDYYEKDTEIPVYKIVPAGDRYSFRYDQLNLFIAKGLEARLTKLEDKDK